MLIVVSVLTVVAIMGVSFVFSMHLETQAARQFLEATKARYVAEAGVAVARAALEEDKLGSRTDDLSESWATHWRGSDVDVDGDETADGAWHLLYDDQQQLSGRYGVLVRDEAGKVNLNTALADPDSLGVDAPNLTTLFEQLGINGAAGVATAIEQYRYGPDGRPGVALVDDDRDGAVDEADEYQVRALRGDDRRFENLEEIVQVATIDAPTLKRLSDVATVYSWDSNLTLLGTPRLNLNTASADELLSVLLATGAENPWQMAATMADYIDPDLSISKLSKRAARYDLTDQGPLGDWTWHVGTPGYYATEVAGGEPLTWSVTVPGGTFYVLMHGVPGTPVGDVEFAGQSKPSMASGETFGTLELSGTVSLHVTCPTGGSACAIGGVELVPTDPTTPGFSTTVVRGVEAIRFHELMIDPKITLGVGEATFDPQISGWTCPSGSGSCSNSGSGQARWSWTNASLKPGQYYVKVYGTQAGQTVGEVRIGTTSQLLTHGDRYPATVTVGSDKKITLTIGKTASEGTYYFKEVVLTLEPDAEYAEFINLSDEPITMSGWVIEGEAARGRQARVPEGSIIPAHGLLVAAVDADDTQAGLAGNGIDVRTAWEIPEEATVVQLTFPDGDMSPDTDWLSTTLPPGAKATLTLRNGEYVVDEVEYRLPLPTVAPFQSIEKGDPTVIEDADNDGIDDGWYPSLKLYTPGALNDNEALRELKGLQEVVHDPTKEITIVNRPLHSVGELAGLPSGIAWSVVSTSDLAKLADRLTVEGLRLETEGHLLSGSGWQEMSDGFQTSNTGAVVILQWLSVPKGNYRLSLYGWPGEQMSVRWQLEDGAMGEWTPALTTDPQGRLTVGQVAAGGVTALPNTFTLEVRCDSTGGVCHAMHIMLDPNLILSGMINVNTASLEVLRALPGMTDAMAQRIISGRPYGDQDRKARGIGDLLIGSTLGETEEDKLANFRRLAHLITVRSNMFQILSVGEAMDRQTAVASKRIQAVVER